MTRDQFIGLTKKGAQNLAEASNLIFRLIRIDKEQYLPYTDEHVAGRVCIEIDKGTVSEAKFQ